jgi:gamma-glutamyltranspeptidase/glutathione hydrolase
VRTNMTDRFRFTSRWTFGWAVCLLIAVVPSLGESDASHASIDEAGPKALVTNRRSVVVTPYPEATQAGVEMLRRGGTAADAAVAAAMVLAVIDTGLTSFAGGGELTYYDAATKKTSALDFYLDAVPEDVRPYPRGSDQASGRAIRIPGSIAGFHAAIQKHGRLSWNDVLGPAIYYAQDGFVLTGFGYSLLQQRYDVLTLQLSGRTILAPNGLLPAVGSNIKQPELAGTLKQLQAKGPEYFYSGSFAKQIVDAVQHIGGKASLQDFAAYKPLELEPIRGTYKEYEIVGPPPPGIGTAAIIEGLNILENVDLSGMGHYSQSVDSLQWVAETLRVMLSDATKYSGIPEFDTPLALLLASKEYARAQYRLIAHKIEVTRHSPAPAAQRAELATISPPDFDDGTHQVSVIDRAGNVCSLTHTISGPIYSSHGLFVGGIVMNSAAGHSAQPGGRVLSALAPIIVFKGKTPYFATGSSGGTTNTFLTALNVLAWGKDLQEAQNAPRLRVAAGAWSAPPGEDDSVYLEHRIDERVAEQLRHRGYRLQWVGPYSQFGAQMAGVDPQSSMRLGATDPRLPGQAAGE